jgi:sialidase-1
LLGGLSLLGLSPGPSEGKYQNWPQEGLLAWYQESGIERVGNRVKGWKNSLTAEPLRHLNRSSGSPQAWQVQRVERPATVVRFDGKSSLWATVESWGSLQEERTLIVVSRPLEPAPGDLAGYLFDGSTAAGMSRAYIAGGRWHLGCQPGPLANASRSSPATLPAKPQVWESQAFQFKPTGDGMLRVTQISPDRKAEVEGIEASPLGGLVLGNNVNLSGGWVGDLAEVLVYRGSLSDRQIAAILKELQQKWGSAEDLDPQPATKIDGSDRDALDPRIKRVVVRREGDDGSKSYRIPALTVTPKGTLVAAFDIRWNGSADLPADIDVGVMRSTDQGDTWGPMIVAMDYDKSVANSRGNGVGDPAILVDRTTGHLFLAALWSQGDNAWNGSGPGLTPEETGQLVIARSTDDGLTWEKPVSITPQIKQPEWRLCFNGPGAGIQLEDGTLVFPAQFRDARGKTSSCFIFSRDQGEKWQISPAAIPDDPPTSESQIVQLPDGSLLMTMRNESRFPQRLWSRWLWTDQLENGQWVETRTDVPDPVCMAGLTIHPAGYVLLSNNNSDRRERMTLRFSSDGNEWSAGKLLDPRPSAYSCLAVLTTGEIGILYECGEHSVQTLTFARFPLDWVLDPLSQESGSAQEN